jgi:hypothetical protein
MAGHFAAAAKCEVGNRRRISVQIDRYDIGQHGDGVGTLRACEPTGSALRCYFPDPPI